MIFREVLPATCEATFATKNFLWKESKHHQGNQTFLQLDQVNFKKPVVSSFLPEDNPLHKLNHPSLKSLFATMGEVLLSETATRACVAKLASQKEEQI